MATAALFPSFTLSGGYGRNNYGDGRSRLGQQQVLERGASVLAPIFDGGTLRYRRKAAIEAYAQAQAGYRQTVLGAFAQVADTLRGLEHDAQTLRAQSEQLAAAEEALRLVQINYRTGTVNYLSVLNADTQYYQAKIGYLETQAQRLQDTAALFVALGGGWWNSRENILGEGAAASKPPAAPEKSAGRGLRRGQRRAR